jgi:anti-sigma factor RsiW
MTCYQSHPDLETLELHLIGRLLQPESREVEDHLLVCEPCRSMAEALDGQIAALQSALVS